MELPFSHRLTLIVRLALQRSFSSPVSPSSQGLPIAQAKLGKEQINKRSVLKFMGSIIRRRETHTITDSTDLMTIFSLKLLSKLLKSSPS
jgi:hypothetical protein